MFDTFYQVPKGLVTCKKLNKTHIIILSDTLSFNSQDMVNFKSQATIAKECGVSLRTASNAISDLKKLGLINAEQCPKHHTLRLTVNKAKLLDYVKQNETKVVSEQWKQSDEKTKSDLNKAGFGQYDDANDEGVRKVCVGGTQILHRGYADFAYNKNIYNNIENNIPNHNHQSSDELGRCEILSSKKRYFIDQISEHSDPVCIYAMETLKQLANEGMENIYLGSLTMQEWEGVQSTLRAFIDESDRMGLDTDKQAVSELIELIYHNRMANKPNTGLTHIASLIESFGDNAEMLINEMEI